LACVADVLQGNAPLVRKNEVGGKHVADRKRVVPCKGESRPKSLAGCRKSEYRDKRGENRS
jgi:hypothetical protein